MMTKYREAHGRRTLICLCCLVVILLPFALIALGTFDAVYGATQPTVNYKEIQLEAKERHDAEQEKPWIPEKFELQEGALLGLMEQMRQPDFLNAPPANMSTALKAVAAKHRKTNLMKSLLSKELQRARGQQNDFCLNVPKEQRKQLMSRDYIKADALLEGHTKLFETYVYARNDIVSQFIISSGAWEAAEVHHVKKVMNRPLRLEDSSIAKADAFIDIGANIGWFSLNMACAGHPTFAFEAMPENQMLMRASMCQNTYKGRPECMQHLTLVPAGLGAKRDHCKLVSDNTNVGDCVTLCGNSTMPSQYITRGEFDVYRLDELVDFDVKALKIDIEGYEPAVFSGAERLFQRRKVWYMMFEYFPSMMIASFDKKTIYDFPRRIASLGYRLSTGSFDGPWLTEQQIDELGINLPWGNNVNVFAARVELAMDQKDPQYDNAGNRHRVLQRARSAERRRPRGQQPAENELQQQHARGAVIVGRDDVTGGVGGPGRKLL